jgi:hypothetical protein
MLGVLHTSVQVTSVVISVAGVIVVLWGTVESVILFIRMRSWQYPGGQTSTKTSSSGTNWAVTCFSD